MPTMTDNALSLWLWPLNALRTGQDLTEAMLGAQRVIAARLPMITSAIADPSAGDHAELGRMVTEKVSAFSASGRSASAAGNAVRQAAGSNARAFGKIAGGGMMWPADWASLLDHNLAAAAAMTALPAAMLAPLAKGVKANDRRLARRAQPAGRPQR